MSREKYPDKLSSNYKPAFRTLIHLTDYENKKEHFNRETGNGRGDDDLRRVGNRIAHNGFPVLR